MTMHFRDRAEVVREGSMIVVPRGIEHRPVAEEEAWIVLFESQSIDHTGGVDSPIGEPPSSACESIVVTSVSRWSPTHQVNADERQHRQNAMKDTQSWSSGLP